MKTVTVGLSIGDDQVTAQWAGDDGDERRFARTIDDNSGLGAALGELSRQLPSAGRVRVAIALLPPIARARRIELPAMSLDERASVVSRVAGRHFLGLASQVVTAVDRDSAVVCAVDAQTVADISATVRALRWEIDRIVPAHAVWMAMALRNWPDLRRTKGTVAVAGAAEWTTLILESGHLTLVRRSARPRTPDLGIHAYTLAADASAAAALAALGAGEVNAFEFVSDGERSERRAAARRFARWMSVAAAACLVGAAGMHRFGLTRELSAIKAARAQIRPQVAAAIGKRDSLTRLTVTLGALGGLEHTSARWTALLGRVAVALPGDASLTSMRADGDSAAFDGEAANAAPVFSALRDAPGILAVKPAAPIRQETVPGAPPIERWMVTVRVDHHAAVIGRRQ